MLSFIWLSQDLPKLVYQPANKHCLHHLPCDGLCKVGVGTLLQRKQENTPVLKIFHLHGEGVINPDEQTAECQVQVNAINKVNKIV